MDSDLYMVNIEPISCVPNSKRQKQKKTIMENHLIYRTNPLYVCIDKYEKYSFGFQGWEISDEYVYNESSPRHSQYSISITSPSISNQDELADYSLQGRKIADTVTELMPICGLPSLNSPRFKSFSSNLALVNYKSVPNGWSSNYSTILSSLNRESGNNCYLDITVEGFIDARALEQSPLPDLQHMMEHYDDAEDPIKFLLFLNNSILSANDINVFLLIGKALEIAFAIGLHNKPKWKEKRPIKNCYPEFAEIFQNITFGDLFDWSNRRKESRHYIKDKSNIESHICLTDEERTNLYRCSINLITIVIRDAFGLSRNPI